MSIKTVLPTTEFRGLDRFREPVNGFMHLTGLVLSLIGTVLLVLRCQPDTLRMVTTAVFGISMCGCFLASTFHHLVRASHRTELWLLKLDHAAIYPFIAGSYTPVCVHMIPGPGGRVLLAIVWLFALVAVVYKLAFEPHPENVSDPPTATQMVPYMVMGWLIVAQLPAVLAASRGNTIILPVIGGLAYTIGGIILTRRLLDLWPGKFGHHEIWHACVLLGAGAMYSFVLLNLT